LVPTWHIIQGSCDIFHTVLLPCSINHVYLRHCTDRRALVHDTYTTGKQQVPKHTSNRIKLFLEAQGVNWWQTPPESPDLHPIENLWHELKEFLRREVKPTTKEELVNGIERFWETVDVAKCQNI